MSSEDLKAKFRAAAAQRGLNSAKDQLKAIKAQKAAMAAAAGPGPSSQRLQLQQQQRPAPVNAASAAQPRSVGGAALPADFFEQATKDTSKREPAPPSTAMEARASGTAGTPATAAAPGPSSQVLVQRPPAGSAAAVAAAGGLGPAGKAIPATEARGQGGAAGASSSALPEGFFTDKVADAQARGVKVPTAADREAEFRAFTAGIDEELKQQALGEAEEAEAEAEEKAEREAFLLQRQQQRLELLRQRKALLLAKAGCGSTGDAAAMSGGSGTAAVLLPELPADDELREAPRPAFGSDDEVDEGVEGVEAPSELNNDGNGTTAVGVAASAGGLKRPRRAVPVLLGKRPRVIDALAMVMTEVGDSGDSGDSSDGEGSDRGIVAPHWRAKQL
ncbi:hypothetical protein Vretimale_5048 [Volvox reticuliferus]|uniref:Uncharacterized protein n=1 Tax=Volvox reticuliferus TaxID=1737510 RepID=A0A8J4FIY4_9CHLO|nr:hypothetical protein Vretifemale_4095 [Volvox reticuliferus]GIL99978.1 hypothetical protein Vretimale_5048 [Volvox reticuliferus]